MGALADGDFENYSYQGGVAVCLSIITGLCGRAYLDKEDPLKSMKVCGAVLSVKFLALAVFIFFMLALSLTFTSLMTLIWMYRLLRYYRAYKIQQADESMGGGDAARYSLMNNA
ncbi:hypothetical protein TrRE_jg11658 [Triparma retinervis]|uniref:Uncharacterized protein n=1 Tax=Triparma retinervis TaxID=2557542 RepID=A0A9W7AI62_9STRA|nr:hypothetical protein TrRE_jg11658 [Triparma retinervis]